jgi:hypothetical protein
MINLGELLISLVSDLLRTYLGQSLDSSIKNPVEADFTNVLGPVGVLPQPPGFWSWAGLLTLTPLLWHTNTPATLDCIRIPNPTIF